MNKIFKIIWSKTRNCYVVVSEMAKQKGKCSSSLNKKIIAAFLAAGTVISVTGSAWAADSPADSLSADEVAKLQQLLKYVIVNSTGTAASATGTDAIAIGAGSTAKAKSAVVIGAGSVVNSGDNALIFGANNTLTNAKNSIIVGTGNTLATGTLSNDLIFGSTNTISYGIENIVIGDGHTLKGTNNSSSSQAKYNVILGTWDKSDATHTSKISNTVMIGHNADAQANSAVAIGNTASSTKASAIAIGNSAQATNTAATAIGLNSVASGESSIAIGREGTGREKTDYSDGFLGEWYNTTASKRDAIAIGTAAQALGVRSVSIGKASRADSEDAVAIGWGAYAEGAESSAYGKGALAIGTSSVAIGRISKAFTSGSVAVGEEANATYHQDKDTGEQTVAVGAYSMVGNSNRGIALGAWSQVEESQAGIAIGGGNFWADEGGYQTLVENSMNGIAIGFEGRVQRSNHGIAAGPYSRVTDSTYGSAFGLDSGVSNSLAGTALGAISKVIDNAGGVALGSQSISDRNGMKFSSAVSDPYYGTDKEAKGGYDLSLPNQGYVHPSSDVLTMLEDYLSDKTEDKKAKLMDAMTWNSTDGVVAVGAFDESTNTFVTRQISGVAAGSADTDAVNVAQLKQAKIHYYSTNDEVPILGEVHKTNYNNDGATGTDSLAAGIAVGTNGMFSAVTGTYSSIIAKNTTGSTTYEGTGASAYGSFNEIKADGDTYDGVGNSVVGLANTTENANGALIFGTGNKITNSYGALDDDQIKELRTAYGTYATAVKFSGVNSQAAKDAYAEFKIKMDAFGVSAPEDGGDVLAIGGANKAYNAVKSSMIGVKNTIGKGSEDVYDETPVEFNSAIGYNNTIENGSNNSIIGTNRTISGVDGAIVIGSAADDGLTTSVVNSVVIGTEANVTLEDKESVALGSYSKADKLGGYATTGEDDVEIGTLKLSSSKFAGTGDNVVGTVSIGYVPESNQKASKPMTRTLTYVGAGEISATSTDAINGSQLFTAIDAMQFDIVAGDNVEVIKSKDEASGHTVYTIHSLNAIVQPGTNNTVTVDGETGTGETNGKTTDMTTSGGNGSDAGSGTDTGTTVTTPEPTTSQDLITPSDNPHTTTYTVDAADSKVKNVAVTKGNSTTSGNKTETDYTVTVTSNEQSVVNGKIETKEVTKEGTFTVIDTDTKYTAEQTTEDGTDYGSGSTTFTVSEMDGEKTGAAVGAATLVAGENVKITKGEDGSAIISAQAGGGMTEISFNGDNKDAQIDNPKVLNIEGGATGELSEGNIGVESDGKDTLTVKLAKDIKGVDSVTVNKTVKVGDKTTIEGDQITTNTVNGDTINTNTINLGDTTIEEGDDNHITYKKGGNTYNIATVEDGMDYAGDDGKAIHKNLAEQLDIVGGAEDKASEYNIYTYNDEDKLRINLAKDVKGVDSVTVNKTVKVGDKTTIEGDKVTVGDTVIEGDQITTNTVKAGDTTINNDGLTIKNGPSITKNGVDAGGKKITNVASGTDGTDAVNVNQLREANQDIYNSMNRLDNSTRKGIAGAAALAALHPLDFDPDDKWEFSAGVGNYRGETAAAIGAFYHPNDDTIFSLGATVGNGENLVNGGVTFRFGQKNHQSRSKKAMAKEIVELRAEVAELKAMVYSMANGRMPGLDLTKSEEFPDTPENHWAYDYVSVLAGNGVLEGYQDGFFKGDRTLTRYEMAAIIYRAMMRGVDVDERMKEEFAPELARVKVDTLTSHSDGTPSIQRVRVIKGRE